MKKNVLNIVSVAILLLFATAGVSFAAGGKITDSVTGSDLEFALSPNVDFDYGGEASSTGGDIDQYALVTWNAQGSKGYGFQHNYEGVLITKQDLDEDGSFTKPTNPGVAEWGDTWMILGSPGKDFPVVLGGTEEAEEGGEGEEGSG